MAIRHRQRGYFIIDPFRFGVNDPFFGTVVQLAHFDGTDGQTGTLTNSCPRGNALSTSGGELDTALSVFGGASLLRTSASASTFAANSSSHADYRFALNDWTVEYRFRIPTIGTYNIFDMSGGNFGAAIAMYILSGQLYLYVNAANRINGGTIANATWYALAVSRVSGNTRMFIDGSQVGSTWADGTNYNFAGTDITMGSTNANPPNASWDELRISNGLYGAGAGRYAANYTPAVAAFPNS